MPQANDHEGNMITFSMDSVPDASSFLTLTGDGSKLMIADRSSTNIVVGTYVLSIKLADAYGWTTYSI